MCQDSFTSCGWNMETTYFYMSNLFVKKKVQLVMKAITQEKLSSTELKCKIKLFE